MRSSPWKSHQSLCLDIILMKQQPNNDDERWLLMGHNGDGDVDVVDADTTDDACDGDDMFAVAVAFIIDTATI